MCILYFCKHSKAWCRIKYVKECLPTTPNLYNFEAILTIFVQVVCILTFVTIIYLHNIYFITVLKCNGI